MNDITLTPIEFWTICGWFTAVGLWLGMIIGYQLRGKHTSSK